MGGDQYKRTESCTTKTNRNFVVAVESGTQSMAPQIEKGELVIKKE